MRTSAVSLCKHKYKHKKKHNNKCKLTNRNMIKNKNKHKNKDIESNKDANNGRGQSRYGIGYLERNGDRDKERRKGFYKLSNVYFPILWAGLPQLLPITFNNFSHLLCDGPS